VHIELSLSKAIDLNNILRLNVGRHLMPPFDNDPSHESAGYNPALRALLALVWFKTELTPPENPAMMNSDDIPV
jgi:hypothetical protein